jgi:predicted esterase
VQDAFGAVAGPAASRNPARHASAGDARFFIQNGDQDCCVGAGQAPLLVDALKKAGVPVTYELIAGVGHGGPVFETHENVATIQAFLVTLRASR